MPEEDPDLLAGDNLDKLRGRGRYSAMSERFRLTELLETAKYQNDLLAQKCRELEKENFHLSANQCHAGYGGEYGHHRCAEIDRLTKERDEARRLYCAAVEEIEHGMTNETKGMVADHFGWDCYRTPEPKVVRTLTAVVGEVQKAEPPVLESENAELRERIKAMHEGFEGCCPCCEPVGEMNKNLRAERDEARRLYCEERAFTIELERGEAGHPPDLAAERGWDCYDRSLQRKKSDAALDELARLDEELGLIPPPPPTDHRFLQDLG